MLHQHPILTKKATSQKKKVHIHFNEKDDRPTIEEDQLSITDAMVKRQNQLLQGERHERIIKKPKKSDQFAYEPNRFIETDYKKIPELATTAASPRRAGKDYKQKTQENSQLLQSKTLQLLMQLLFHPNRNNKNIINCDISNKWILDTSCPLKLKSFLILYMILYQFESIQFRFRKSHHPNAKNDLKIISIEEIKNKKEIDPNLQNDPLYQQFKQNQMQKYLSEYVEWLVWKNSDKFEVEEGNIEFWAMATNTCEQVASELIRSKNTRDRNRNIFLSLFLMNAEDSIFRSTLQIPRGQKILMYMLKQDLELLPKCHWVLGLNMSVKYFFNKKFDDRVKESLNPNNIEESQIKQFEHEYRLLCNYFNQPIAGKQQKSKKIQKQSLTDCLIEWMGVESGCVGKKALENVEYNEELNRKICSSLLQKAVENSKNISQVEEYILMAIELLERQTFLSPDKKDTIISEILYNNERIASNLGKLFPQIINKLQHRKQTQLPKLFQRLTVEYNSLYKHLLLSNNPAIKNDLLAQLKHLSDIEIGRQDAQIKHRIRIIFSSFNLIAHWNKQVVKSLVFLLEKYIEKVNQYKFNEQIGKAMIEEENAEGKEKSEGENDKEIRQLQTLSVFLKVHLKLQPLNLKNLVSLIEFINEAAKSSTIIQFEPRTINFIKKDILSSLFSKNGFNEALLLQIKKHSLPNAKISIEGLNLPQNYNLLEELAKLSAGVKYFENQVQLLKQQASIMINTD